jgi:hypothetical protein
MNLERTLQQYDAALMKCRQVFGIKTKDYGTAWRILRMPSLTDQLFIKGSRIRSIEEKGAQKVDDSIAQEFIGLVNYSLIALIQQGLDSDTPQEMDVDEVITLYDQQVAETRNLFTDKNHDYDEIWRDMRITSMTDLILMKILRIKQIEDNEGSTLISEGVDANYRDIINYAIFALIKIDEKVHS